MEAFLDGRRNMGFKRDTCPGRPRGVSQFPKDKPLSLGNLKPLDRKCCGVLFSIKTFRKALEAGFSFQFALLYFILFFLNISLTWF